ncbi:MAG: hypothetical protein GHHEDOFH_02544 [Pseudorhodoplanes sp.]|nr:hypothetical protein [Pseudorhodoplanes sp.]GIK80411.1 MAG: hypothetical protein BroJett024_15160 [Alphaproteobacteria bacterium]
MQFDQIIRELEQTRTLPVDALRKAQINRDLITPELLRVIERYIAADSNTRSRPNAVFFAFHLLGSWRAKSAYPLLATFLRQNPADLEDVLGDAITATSHRVMACVFDGDPGPLYGIITDTGADEFIRSRMCEALAMVVLQGDLPKSEAGRFLQRGFSEIKPIRNCQVWVGWKNAIAMLGLSELTPLVREAYERHSIDEALGTFQQFEEEDMAFDGRGAQRHPSWMQNEYTPFGDIVEELSAWQQFRKP